MESHIPDEDQTGLFEVKFPHIPKLIALYLTSTLLLPMTLLLLTPPSYKIAPNKGTITGGRLFVNRSYLFGVSIYLNGLSICLSKHQRFTRCHFQESHNFVDRFHVLLIGSLHKLADNTHNKRKIRTSMG